jgi:transglutaminase/protease-like cytokinesis protein 3
MISFSTVYIFYFIIAFVIFLFDPFHVLRHSEHSQITNVNPKYASAISGNNVDNGTDAIGASSSQETESFECSDKETLSKIVRENMLSRVTDFSVVYAGSTASPILTKETFNEFLEEIFSVDDKATSSDYDYLKLSWTSAQLKVENDRSGTVYSFSFRYLTTDQEEAYIDQKTSDIIASLHLEGLSDYEKVKAVNDYLVNAVAYDSTLAHKSAYDALDSGSTICRGYGLLAYKMLTKLSVPVRIITGTADGEPHAWNLVRVGDEWFNLDVTWNDSTASDRFFLKNNEDFILHESTVSGL